jgi:predicted ribosomally synthesized peptide with SipW-like signal peptide
MKRIITSLALIVSALGIAAAGSTGAFFSDTETSSGNVFTAGSIDLKIDHSLSTYNGGNVGGDLVIVSDPQTTFAGDDGSGNAVNLSFVHPAWAHNLEPAAHWIWATNPVVAPTIVPRQNTFTRTFNWNGPVISASLDLAADNTYIITLNGNPIGSNGGEFNYGSTVHFDVTGSIQQGVNTLVVTVGNLGVADTEPASNPAGLIFRLEVHGQQLFSDPIDLPGQPFWTFDDVKPADQGRDVFSLHVDTNDAWACMIVSNIENEENSLLEPEIAAGDNTPGPGNGELGQFLKLFLWRDTNNNGIFEPGSGEVPLTPPTGESFAGPGPLIIPVNDSSLPGGPLLSGSTGYVGSAWCVGTMSVNLVTGNITCDGNTPNINRSQTDSTKADLTFYATQSRNQPTFSCANLESESL